MSWIKELYGARASDKRYIILAAPNGTTTAIPAGGAPNIPKDWNNWQEVARVNRPLPRHLSHLLYLSLL